MLPVVALHFLVEALGVLDVDFHVWFAVPGKRKVQIDLARYEDTSPYEMPGENTWFSGLNI